MIREIDDISYTCDNCLKQADYAIKAEETEQQEVRFCGECMKEIIKHINILIDDKIL